MKRKTNQIKSLETVLGKIALHSSQDSKATFGWLISHFNEENLRRCFHGLKDKKAVGTDGCTKETYKKTLGRNIQGLIARMKTMSYRPQPVREVLIDKPNGEKRALGIACIEDKVVQSLMQQILQAIYEPRFKDCSYGFRPKRSCHQAIKAVRDFAGKHDVGAVIDVDIENFFGSIDHKKLTALLRLRIKDEVFIRYVVRMLKSGVVKEGRKHKTTQGTPQGGLVSPVLANIFAHHCFDIWFEQMTGKLKGKEKLVRYCDDIVILCERREDGKVIYPDLIRRVERFSLKLNEKKTKIVSFSRRRSLQGEKQGTFDFLGSLSI